ncbi:Hypothetical protein RY67_200 [Bifidobacterium longum subsp. infantis]|uniref:Uncharacterized protein n=1 Tax=Bifidobacterium longum subsp. infantis TaxID=1682 RepID=A0A0M4LGI8_BIFLI|nr:Hypothetical protein RY67_200 [Bifidobacterium longum subsp. infantis]
MVACISDTLIASPSILKPLLGGMSISIEGLLLAKRIVEREKVLPRLVMMFGLESMRQ